MKSQEYVHSYSRNTKERGLRKEIEHGSEREESVFTSWIVFSVWFQLHHKDYADVH